MDRLNSVGVKIPETLPEIYHQPANKFWWFNPEDEYWQELTQDSVKSMLIGRFGFNAVPKARGMLSAVETALTDIKVKNRIEAVVNMGWEEMGILMVDGRRVLVDRGATRIEPRPGEWPELRKYLIGLFGPEQIDYTLGWLQTAARGFYDPKQRQLGQALILCGDKRSGKSFFQMRVVTPILGGRVGRPYEWLTGQTPFNSELFEAVHLLAEDEFRIQDADSRMELGAAIKKIAANRVQKYNKKHGATFNCEPYWRLTISLNGQPRHLATLPDIDDSMKEKVIIVKTNADAITLPTYVPGGGNPMEEAVAAELPGFIHYLLHDHVIPEELRDYRYGVKGFVHPDITRALHEMSPEKLLRDELRRVYAGANQLFKTTRDVMEDLESPTVVSAIRQNVARKHYKVQDLLYTLATIDDSGVVEKLGGWLLTFPERVAPKSGTYGG